MTKRPMCLALAVFLAGILIINILLPLSVPEGIPSEKKKGTLSGKVETVDDIESECIILNDAVFACEDSNLSIGKVKVYGGFEGVFPGNCVSLEGSLIPLTHPANSGQFDEFSYYAAEGINAKFYADSFVVTNSGTRYIKTLLFKLKRLMYGVYMSIMPEKEASVVSAMLLGEKKGLDESVKDLYSESGISHILAISGLHISVIGYSVYRILRKATKFNILAVIVSVVLILLYGVLSDFSVSTQRAVIMLIVMLFSRPLGRVYDEKSAMAFSACVILLRSPRLLFSASFLFSYSAVIGIFYILPAFKKRFSKGVKGFGKIVLDSFLMSVSVQIATFPASVWFYHEFHTYSIVINMLILPLTSLLFSILIIGGAAAVIIPFLGRFIIGGAFYLLEFIELVCRTFRKLPFSTVLISAEDFYYVCILTLCITVIALSVKKNIKRGAAVLCMALIFVLFVKENNMIGILDVGQGECAHIKAGGQSILIDGGSTDIKNAGEYRIIPYLKYNGVSVIDFIFISHTDNDHISGIIELLEKTDKNDGVPGKAEYKGNILIRNIVIPDFRKSGEAGLNEDENLKKITELAEEKNVKIVHAKKGFEVAYNDLAIKCIAPLYEKVYNDKNDASMMLDIRFFGNSLLFTGDTGKSELNDIFADTNKSEGYDLVKVPHHGSRNSASDIFYDTVSKRSTLFYISCGAGNRYGHPHKEVTELTDMHSECPVTITAFSGGQYVRNSGGRLVFQSMIDNDFAK